MKQPGGYTVPAIYVDDDNIIENGFGRRIYSYPGIYTQSAFPNIILVPGETYRIYYATNSGNTQIYLGSSSIAPLSEYSYDTSLILNLQVHKCDDLFPAPYNHTDYSQYIFEETTNIPFWSESDLRFNSVNPFLWIND